MNIEDCEVGMKVIRRKRGKTRALKEGEKYTIKRIYKNSIWIKENPGVKYLPKYFEPLNKFKVGDEAIWHNHKVKIWGKRYNKEFKKYEYAVTDKNNGRIFLFENELSPLKKPDELEVGDKFKANCGRKYKILFVEKDDFHNKMAYFSKTINGTYKGVLRIFYPNDVEEIIYD